MMDDELLKALANYHGPVKRCRPGHARGKRVKPVPVMRDRAVNVHHEREALKDDEAARWLCEHDPVVIAAERRRVRREQRRERWLKQQRGKEILSARPPLRTFLVVVPTLNAMVASPVGGEDFFRYLR